MSADKLFRDLVMNIYPIEQFIHRLDWAVDRTVAFNLQQVIEKMLKYKIRESGQKVKFTQDILLLLKLHQKMCYQGNFRLN